jgi:hypothetical protein
MKNSNKYDALRKFILENFGTTTNINDRLHTRDKVNKVYDDKVYDDVVFKEMKKLMILF